MPINSCGEDTLCQVLTVNCPVPVADYTYQAQNLTVTYTDQSTNNPTAWDWDFGDGSTSSLQNPEHTFAGSGNYTTCLMPINSCGEDTLCSLVVAVQSCSDNDGDGYGSPGQDDCPNGSETDCDDGNDAIFPGAPEILCDTVDQNCNGIADDDQNLDGDPVSFCDGDCDDSSEFRYPGNPEVCDELDNDCNNIPDDGLFFDCAGICEGAAVLDDCNECTGGTTGQLWNWAMDCSGDCFGAAFTNECGCVSGNSGFEEFWCYGCTDPLAVNYEPDALFDDGSCIDGIQGDINGDGLVNVLDIVVLVDIILTTPILSDEEFAIADINSDGGINVLDVVLLVDFILNP